MKRFGTHFMHLIIRPVMLILPLVANFYFVNPVIEMIFDLSIEVMGGLLIYSLLDKSMDQEIINFLIEKIKLIK